VVTIFFVFQATGACLCGIIKYIRKGFNICLSRKFNRHRNLFLIKCFLLVLSSHYWANKHFTISLRSSAPIWKVQTKKLQKKISAIFKRRNAEKLQFWKWKTRHITRSNRLSLALPLNCILTYQIHPNSVSKKKKPNSNSKQLTYLKILPSDPSRDSRSRIFIFFRATSDFSLNSPPVRFSPAN